MDAAGSDISGILAAARTLRDKKPTQILVTGYWNVFADGDVASASETPAASPGSIAGLHPRRILCSHQPELPT